MDEQGRYLYEDWLDADLAREVEQITAEEQAEAEAAAREAADRARYTHSDRPQRAAARVERVEVRTGESAGTLTAVAHGRHPDTCTEVGEVSGIRHGRTFRFAISTRRGPGSCDAPGPTFQAPIALDVRDLAAGRYTVDVNGALGDFAVTAGGGLSVPK